MITYLIDEVFDNTEIHQRRLVTSGRSLLDMVENAIITEVDNDGVELNYTPIEQLPTEEVYRVVRMIQEYLDLEGAFV